MENLNKYYIRLNDKNKIIHYFSSVFEKPLDTDIFVGEGSKSQFNVSKELLSEGLYNFAGEENSLDFVDENSGLYTLKFENGIISKVDENDEDFIQYATVSKYKELTERCNNTILSGFETDEGKFYQFAEKDQTNFTQQTILLIMDSSITTVIWESGDQDGKFVEYTKEAFLKLIGQAQLHKNTNISKLTTLRSQLDSAKTIEEIKSIEW